MQNLFQRIQNYELSETINVRIYKHEGFQPHRVHRKKIEENSGGEESEIFLNLGIFWNYPPEKWTKLRILGANTKNINITNLLRN